MGLDIKIPDKSLKETKHVSSTGKFHFTKNWLFHNFCKESFLIS